MGTFYVEKGQQPGYTKGMFRAEQAQNWQLKSADFAVSAALSIFDTESQSRIDRNTL